MPGRWLAETLVGLPHATPLRPPQGHIRDRGVCWGTRTRWFESRNYFISFTFQKSSFYFQEQWHITPRPTRLTSFSLDVARFRPQHICFCTLRLYEDGSMHLNTTCRRQHIINTHPRLHPPHLRTFSHPYGSALTQSPEREVAEPLLGARSQMTV